jgi:hypothetical protein
MVGHALGVYHEQSRSDRDDFVTINVDNIDPKKVGNYEKTSFTSVGAYDFGSIMHYGSYYFSANKKPSMTKKSGAIITPKPRRALREGRGGHSLDLREREALGARCRDRRRDDDGERLPSSRSRSQGDGPLGHPEGKGPDATRPERRRLPLGRVRRQARLGLGELHRALSASRDAADRHARVQYDAREVAMGVRRGRRRWPRSVARYAATNCFSTSFL